jgi:hypothetical protein
MVETGQIHLIVDKLRPGIILLQHRKEVDNVRVLEKQINVNFRKKKS